MYEFFVHFKLFFSAENDPESAWRDIREPLLSVSAAEIAVKLEISKRMVYTYINMEVAEDGIPMPEKKAYTPRPKTSEIETAGAVCDSTTSPDGATVELPARVSVAKRTSTPVVKSTQAIFNCCFSCELLGDEIGRASWRERV